MWSEVRPFPTNGRRAARKLTRVSGGYGRWRMSEWGFRANAPRGNESGPARAIWGAAPARACQSVSPDRTAILPFNWVVARVTAGSTRLAYFSLAQLSVIGSVTTLSVSVISTVEGPPRPGVPGTGPVGYPGGGVVG